MSIMYEIRRAIFINEFGIRSDPVLQQFLYGKWTNVETITLPGSVKKDNIIKYKNDSPCSDRYCNIDSITKCETCGRVGMKGSAFVDSKYLEEP